MSTQDKLPPGYGTQRIPAYVTTITFYSVTEYADSGSSIRFGAFLNRDIALLAARGKGGWGQDGGGDNVTMRVVVYTDPMTGQETIREVGSNVSLEFRDADPRVQEALSKLQPADVDALMKTLFR